MLLNRRRNFLLKQRTRGRLAAIPVCIPRFSNLREPMFLSVTMSLLLAAGPRIVRADSGDEADGDKITALIKQLSAEESLIFSYVLRDVPQYDR